MYTYALKICPTLRAFRERIDKQNKKKNIDSLQSPNRYECIGRLVIFQSDFCDLEILRYYEYTGRNIGSSST